MHFRRLNGKRSNFIKTVVTWRFVALGRVPIYFGLLNFEKFNFNIVHYRYYQWKLGGWVWSLTFVDNLLIGIICAYKGLVEWLQNLMKRSQTIG